MLLGPRAAGHILALGCVLVLAGCTDRHTWHVNADPCVPPAVAEEGLRVVAYTGADGNRHSFAGRVHVAPNGALVLEPERGDATRTIAASDIASIEYEQPHHESGAFILGLVLGIAVASFLVWTPL